MGRKLRRPKVKHLFELSLINKGNASWTHCLLYNEKIDIELNASFLNFSKQLSLPVDWNLEEPSKLWVYNLHYFEDLLADGAESKYGLHVWLLERWITDNAVGKGNGWEPYPISLRVVNVLKAWLGGLSLSDVILKSIFEQASYLSNDLEKHLLGNHYFVNLKALFFSGVVFGQLHWKEIAVSELLIQIPEQILPDGANFELTPMYHSLILIDMLDMYNLSITYPDEIAIEFSGLLKLYIPKMLNFMESMSHPDGKVSFFNDSVDGIAPGKERILKYAEALGFYLEPAPRNTLAIVDNTYSGYYAATAGENKLIFDAANIGPDYIPGHAHADTLSFEMSIGWERVFVNAGISEYGVGPLRIQQRKTSAHNTVEVDRRDSSQVWSGFRVAKRAKITARKGQILPDNTVYLHAAHDGYKTLFGGCIHARDLFFSQNSLKVVDKFLGRFKIARVRFHFHPDLQVSFENSLLTVTGAHFTMVSQIDILTSRLLSSTWHPEFGLSLANHVLEIEFSSEELQVEFTWTSH